MTPYAQILGDNVFYSRRPDNAQQGYGAYIRRDDLQLSVKKARAFGVVEFDENNRVIGIEEKPGASKVQLYAVRDSTSTTIA
ncbi:MAG: sugar phosphate nucleotidyltransferase [Eubacteriales bacterium]